MASIRDRVKELRRVPAKELKANPKNWRTHPQQQRDALRGILEEIGFAGACVARELPDGSLQLIDGHLRTEDAGDAKIPVLILDVNEAEADKLLATFDPLSAMAQADASQLQNLLSGMKTDNDALEAMLKGLAAQYPLPIPEAPADIDDIPEPPKVPITKPGDLWILGNHRLLCGDSTKAEDVARLMNGAKVNVCFTSPPYGQQRDYTAAGKEKCVDWLGLMEGVFGQISQAVTDDAQIIVNLGLIHLEGELVPYWESWIEWMRSKSWRRFGWYVWDQMAGLPGDWNGRFAPSHEWIFHFNRKSMRPSKIVSCKPDNVGIGDSEAARRANGRPVLGMRKADGVVAERSSTKRNSNKIPDSVVRISRCATIDMARKLHPATFPVQLPAFILSAWPGSVIDPFGGSGTTMIAAEQCGRKSFLMELAPEYCDVALIRWEKLTGKKATLEKPESPKVKS